MFWKILSQEQYFIYDPFPCNSSLQSAHHCPYLVNAVITRISPTTERCQVDRAALSFFKKIQKPPLIEFYLVRMTLRNRQMCTIQYGIMRHLRDILNSGKSRRAWRTPGTIKPEDCWSREYMSGQQRKLFSWSHATSVVLMTILRFGTCITSQGRPFQTCSYSIFGKLKILLQFGDSIQWLD